MLGKKKIEHFSYADYKNQKTEMAEEKNWAFYQPPVALQLPCSYKNNVNALKIFSFSLCG